MSCNYELSLIIKFIYSHLLTVDCSSSAPVHAHPIIPVSSDVSRWLDAPQLNRTTNCHRRAMTRRCHVLKANKKHIIYAINIIFTNKWNWALFLIKFPIKPTNTHPRHSSWDMWDDDLPHWRWRCTAHPPGQPCQTCRLDVSVRACHRSRDLWVWAKSVDSRPRERRLHPLSAVQSPVTLPPLLQRPFALPTSHFVRLLCPQVGSSRVRFRHRVRDSTSKGTFSPI